jgi:outer membrane protein TolC
MKRLTFIISLLTLFLQNLSAQPLSLEKCYELARQNYPLIVQKELIAQSKEFTVANAHSGNMPQVAIYAQATYQSDVTRLSIDNPAFPKIQPLSKDQYKIYAEINQNIYDGGTIKRTSALHETNALISDQQIEVELYKIRDRINQLYFGILLLNQQLAQVDLLKKDIQSSKAKVKASIENGTAFRMNADILDAELLKAEQRTIEVNASKGLSLIHI